MGHVATVNKLIAAGANVDAITPRSTSALDVAARHGHTLCVRALLNAGARIGPKTLTMAAKSGDIETITTLCNAGDPEAFDDRCGQAIAEATRQNHSAAVEHLAGISTAQEVRGIGLSTACYENNRSIAAMLIPITTPKQHRVAQTIARNAGHHELADWLDAQHHLSIDGA